MNAIEQAQQLQAQAIAILLPEREQHLVQLCHGQTTGKKRGRPAKLSPTPDSPDTK